MGSWRALGWLAGRWLRRRAIAVIPVAVIAAAGTTGAVVALDAAHDTSNAYPDYLRRSAASDVVVNPSFATTEIDALIRSLDGVERITSETMFVATNDEGEPRPRGEVDFTGWLTVYGSSDGRYIDTDRPIVRAGRVATGPNEAMVTVEAAQRTGLGVGDVIPLAFWGIGTDDSIPPTIEPDVYEELMNAVVEPIAVEHVEIVGIVTMADEMLPDDLYPRGELIVSPDVAARYECTLPVPGKEVPVSELYGGINPPGCATAYRYYSLTLRAGPAAVKPTLDAYLAQASELNAQLAATGTGFSYFMVPTETDRLAGAVERAIRPTVTALVVLGLAGAAVTVALVGLLAVRELRRTAGDQRQWQQLGIAAGARAVVVALPPAGAVALGVAVGCVAAWVLDLGPVGLVDAVEHAPARSLAVVARIAAAAIGVVAMAMIAVLAQFAVRRDAAAGRRPATGDASRRMAGAAIGSPAVADGVRAAYGRRAAIPVVAVCATLVGTFAAAFVFGASFGRLVATPASYGWSWDVAAITGGGYGDLDIERATETLSTDPDVEHWTALGFVNEATLDNEPMGTLITFERESDTALRLLEGALPVRADEVAVGATTASERGLDVGDAVIIGGGFEPIEATVSGIVVFPALGPWFADRVGAGTGLLVPQAMFDRAELRVDLEGEDIRDLATFVGVELRDGSDTAEVRERLRRELAVLDLANPEPFVYTEAVEPPEILGARSTLAVPAVVGAVFAATAGVGLGFASWASVRSRRRELAVLRTLGFCGRQVRRSVRVQSVATMAAALVVGVPVGVLVGRWLWRAFAHQLGVVPDPAAPWAPALLTIGAGLVLAVVAAQVPAQIAARARPAEGLRSE